jgi:hypothetical protein
MQDYDELSALPWRAIVVDEAHRLRTAGNKLTDCLAAILAKGEAEYVPAAAYSWDMKLLCFFVFCGCRSHFVTGIPATLIFAGLGSNCDS